MRVSFIQPRHGTPFVTILSIAVEQESDRGLSATRPPPFASPSYRAHRFFSISREDLLSLPPIPINPFPRIDDRIHTHTHTAQGPASSKNSIETFDPSATATFASLCLWRDREIGRGKAEGGGSLSPRIFDPRGEPLPAAIPATWRI